MPVFGQFGLRTVGDACPYNARKDTSSILCANRYKIYTVTIIIKTLISWCFSIFQFIHLHHPHHYNTNRQRKQVLCPNSFVADSRGRLSLRFLNILMITSLRLAFFYPIRRIGMESPREVRCMEFVPLARNGITRQRVSTFGLMPYITS